MSALLRRLVGPLALAATAAIAAAAIVVTRGLGGVAWGRPWAFALLPIALAIPLQPLLTGQLRLVVPQLGRARGGPRAAIAWLPTWLSTVGATLLVVAFARPVVTHHDELTLSQGLDILLAIDTSGSMREEDFIARGRPISRLSAAKGVLKDFIEGRPHDRLGLEVFGEEAFTHIPLTLDHATLQRALADVDFGMAGQRGTAVGTAIAIGTKRLKELEAPEKLLILLTDGRSNAGRLAPEEAAQLAIPLGVRIYTIGIGSVQAELAGEGIDEPTLRAVAEATGGRYFRATDLASLRAVYDTIDELETSPAEVRQLVRYDERFRALLAPAFALLCAALVLGQTVLRRGP